MSLNALVAAGFTVVMICGELDLSVSSTLTLGAMLVIGLRPTLGWGGSLLAALGAGVLVGLANGVLVTRARIHSFIATLGTMTVAQGVIYMYSHGSSVSVTGAGDFALADFLETPVLPLLPPRVLVTLVFVVVIQWVLSCTRPGRNLYLVGGSKETAWLAGLNPHAYVTAAFVLSGFCAALGGALFAMGISSATTDLGVSALMDVITATIIGGTAMAGGRGSVVRSALAVLTFAAMFNGFNRLGFGSELRIFVAGLVLSESDHNHQALSDIIPLRDIFGLLFFVSVGMLVDPAYVRTHLGVVLGMAALVAVAKGAVFAGLSHGFGYRNIVPLAMGLTMFQAGEFAFVLARVGVTAGGLDADHYSLILSVALVTMFATPLVSGLTTPLYRRLRSHSDVDPVLTINVGECRLRDHVIIAGAGHVGLAAARVLRALDLQVVVVELDQWRLESCRAAGIAVIYGDASYPAVLEAAGLAGARLLIVTTPATETVLAIARLAREKRPQLHIVARADSEASLNDLYAMGVYEVVQPQREAGLEMTRQALLHLDVPAPEIAAMLERARREAGGPRLSAPFRSPAP
jgi:ribose/xylose/arabinose/galactoside ABC-type transport system permease subunit/voltage-gated potassium channel Kch